MFLSFVQKSKLRLTSSKLKWLVIGNESADMDSIVGSLVYSYCKQEKIGNNFDVIPVCCIPKDKMKLKNDVNKWLQIFEIDPFCDLVFLEDVIDLLNNQKPEYPVHISLVDHHKPQLPVMTNSIREVVDHRASVFNYPIGQLNINNNELVGSCCTLISEYITDDIMLEEKQILFKMLHGVILVDTECLKPNNGKTTTKDINTVENIENFLRLPLKSRSDVYTLLSQAKNDITGFSIAMMVHRDLKMLDFKWNNMNIRMAIPTLISIDVEDLLATDNLDSQLMEVLDELKANIIICLTCGTESLPRRGYLIFSKIRRLNEKIYEYLQLPEHKLNLLTLVHRENLESFYQSDLRVSRKMFIPIVDKFFNENQDNNSNIDGNDVTNIIVKTDDLDIAVECEEAHESEGAPYTLNTPLRSYSGSPDNRNSEMTLPSLNNRYTQQLVDRKRKKHRDEVNEDMNHDDDIHILDKVNNDDVSPPAFTPENSDDESTSSHCSDDNNDNIGPLPTFKHALLPESFKDRRKNPSVKNSSDSIVKSENDSPNLKLSSATVNEYKTSKFSHFDEKDVNDSEFVSLAEKVDKKRQKLKNSHINSIASKLVNDVLHNSETIIIDEIDIESFLDDWSECYTDEEKKQIVDCVQNNDMTQLAQLLTACLINDCLNVTENIDTDVTDSQAQRETELRVYFDCDSFEDPDSLDNIFPLRDNYSDCHMGNIINEENQCILSNNVNSSSADVVENISFNLYRRISSNQLNYSDDEKELLISAGDWLPKEDVIYSDPEFEDQNDYSNQDEDIRNVVSAKMLSLDKNICMDGSTNSL